MPQVLESTYLICFLTNLSEPVHVMSRKESLLQTKLQSGLQRAAGFLKKQ